jgi:hypothetical protein
MARDLRVILYRREWQELLRAPDAAKRHHFGGDYVDLVLTEMYRTDARKLASLLPTWTVAQRTTYSLNNFVGEVLNGGISQFFFNGNGVLFAEVLAALARVGADSVRARYAAELENYNRREPTLSGIYQETQQSGDWEGFRSFKAALSQSDPSESFDEWFYGGREGELDDLLRNYLGSHANQAVRFCDDDKGLASEKARRGIRDVSETLLGYLNSGNPTAQGLCLLLITPECFPPFIRTDQDRALFAVKHLSDRKALLKRLARAKGKIEFTEPNGILTVRARQSWGWFSSATIALRFRMQGHFWRIEGWG